MSTLLERNWIPLDSSFNNAVVFWFFLCLQYCDAYYRKKQDWRLLQVQALYVQTPASASPLVQHQVTTAVILPHILQVTSAARKGRWETTAAWDWCLLMLQAEAWCRNRNGFWDYLNSVTAMKQDKFALLVHRWVTRGEGAFCNVISKDSDTIFF